MNLIHVVPALSQESSGPTYSVVRLCQSLIARDHQLVLAALDWEPLSNLPHFVRTFEVGMGPRRLGRSPSMCRWLTQRASLGETDVIHNHGMWQMNAVYPAWAAKRTRVGLIYSPRGAFSTWAMSQGSRAKRVFWPLFQEPALRSATCFHATAESEYLDIRRLGFRQPVAILPNGIDIPRLLPPTNGGRRTLLFLGRVHPVKGLDILLPAWRKVQDAFPDWRLVIAGSDVGYHGASGYLAEVKAQARQLGLERVEFPGALYGSDKLRAFGSAEIFVLPSYSENFGVAVAEALSLGTPAIVSRGAPWPGLLERNAGWWIDAGVDSLVACLREGLSQSAVELAAMGQRGRAWMQTEYSWDRVASKMAATYRWLRGEDTEVPPWVRVD